MKYLPKSETPYLGVIHVLMLLTRVAMRFINLLSSQSLLLNYLILHEVFSVRKPDVEGMINLTPCNIKYSGTQGGGDQTLEALRCQVQRNPSCR